MNNHISPVTLATLDYLIMAAYMLFLIVMSLYYRKFAQSSMDNFFLGGRNLKGWLNGTSYAATCMNADVAPAYCGMNFTNCASAAHQRF